ncbi:MAG: hypothetical protein FE043_04080 [Thermoplasmata archaeon]|nr:MAG: hypothetical protein FE043_04080 [Thermoplasmata archaeon]
MDFTTLTILAILSFILAWFGIMIFTTTPKEEEEEQANTQQVKVEVPVASVNPEVQAVNDSNGIKKVARIAEGNENQTVATVNADINAYRELVEKYSNTIAQLKQKIDLLENPERSAGIPNDKLIDWITELRNENKYLKAQLSRLEGDKMAYENSGFSSEKEASLKYENMKLREKLDEHVEKVAKLEKEVEELKSGLNYYRDIVNKLQGSYTVINKYNYRTCIRDPNTGEFQYELVKFPLDFDPFNPTYITKDGMEIYERFGIKIPTKLGDIVREEFRKSAEYWEEDTGVDWKLGR